MTNHGSFLSIFGINTKKIAVPATAERAIRSTLSLLPITLRAMPSYAVRVFLLLAFLAFTRTTSAAEECDALRSTFEKWLAAYAKRDIAATMSLFTDDVSYSFQGGPDAKKADLKKSYRDEFARPQPSGKWLLEFEESECFGKVGFVRSIWRLEIKRDDGKTEIKFENRSVDILRLSDDGTWKIFRSFNYPVIAP